MSQETKKVFHPKHGNGTISKTLLESAGSEDTIKVQFGEEVKTVKKSELKTIFHS